MDSITYLKTSDLKIPELLIPSQEYLEKTFTLSTVIPSLIDIYESHGNIELHIHFIRHNFFFQILYSDGIITLLFSMKLFLRMNLILIRRIFHTMWVSTLIKERGESYKYFLPQNLLYLHDEHSV